MRSIADDSMNDKQQSINKVWIKLFFGMLLIIVLQITQIGVAIGFLFFKLYLGREFSYLDFWREDRPASIREFLQFAGADSCVGLDAGDIVDRHVVPAFSLQVDEVGEP